MGKLKNMTKKDRDAAMSQLEGLGSVGYGLTSSYRFAYGKSNLKAKSYKTEEEATKAISRNLKVSEDEAKEMVGKYGKDITKDEVTQMQHQARKSTMFSSMVGSDKAKVDESAAMMNKAMEKLANAIDGNVMQVREVSKDNIKGVKGAEIDNPDPNAGATSGKSH